MRRIDISHHYLRRIDFRSWSKNILLYIIRIQWRNRSEAEKPCARSLGGKGVPHNFQNFHLGGVISSGCCPQTLAKQLCWATLQYPLNTHSVPTQYPLNTHPIPTGKYGHAGNQRFRPIDSFLVIAPHYSIYQWVLGGYWVGIEWVLSGYWVGIARTPQQRPRDPKGTMRTCGTMRRNLSVNTLLQNTCGMHHHNKLG